MSDILVISYSNTGTSRQLARMLCEQQGWPMAEIREMQPRCGLSGQLRCLLDSWFRRRPLICYVGPAPNEYDAVILVAPVWSWRLAGPVRSFVKLMKEQLPDLAMISVSQGFGTEGVISELNSLMGYFPVLSTTFTPEEINNKSCLERLQVFGKATQVAENNQVLIQQSVCKPLMDFFKEFISTSAVIFFLSSQIGK